MNTNAQAQSQQFSVEERKFYAQLKGEFVGRVGEFVTVICLTGNGTKPDREVAPHERVSVMLGIVNGERLNINPETRVMSLPVSEHVVAVIEAQSEEVQAICVDTPIVIRSPHDQHSALQHALNEDRFVWRMANDTHSGIAIAILVGDDTLSRFIYPDADENWRGVERYREEYLPGMTETLGRMARLLSRPLPSVTRLEKPLVKRWEQLHKKTLIDLATQHRELTSMTHGAVPSGAHDADIKQTMPAIPGLKVQIQEEIERAELFGLKRHDTVLAALHVINDTFEP